MALFLQMLFCALLPNSIYVLCPIIGRAELPCQSSKEYNEKNKQPCLEMCEGPRHGGDGFHLLFVGGKP